MGVAVGDVGGDGRIDLFTTTFSEEYYPFFRNLERPGSRKSPSRWDWPPGPCPIWDGPRFSSTSTTTGSWTCSSPMGIYSRKWNPSLETYRQPDLLFRGNGEFGFQDVTDQVDLHQAPVRSSRGGATCDYDNDGDLDLLVLAIDDSPTLLRNDGGNRRTGSSSGSRADAATGPPSARGSRS